MSTVFREIPIEELCTKVTSGLTPLRSRSDFYENGTIDWYKTGELNDWYLEPAKERISDRVFKETSIKLFPTDTVLMAMYGDGKTITSMGILRAPAATNQACAAMFVDRKKCHPRYFFYALKSRRELLLTIASGGAQRNLSGKLIKEFQLPIPPLPIQQRIAGILSAYDELIENSQRRIKILEAMARGLYREWFVYFRFPGHENHPLVASSLGEIPQGWKVRSIKDVAVVTYGFPFQSKKFNTNQIGLPVIRIRDILDASTTTFTDEVAEAKYHIKNGDILVGMDGDFHMCIWSSGHALQNQRVAKFESSSAIGNHHLFLALELPIQTWNKSIVGTTVAHLGDMHIKSIQIVWPNEHVLKMANQVLEPMAEQIIALKRQIQNLRRTRDLLLPRLLSGQINVEAAEHV